MEEILKFTIPGMPVVKKSTAKTSNFMKRKNGVSVPRKYPIHYYSEAYNKWAEKAIVACHNAKVENNITMPISVPIHLKLLFFIDTMRIVDLSALYEGVQDVICGNAGYKKDAIPSNYYQLLVDDSIRYIVSHDGSRVYLDPLNPRTEVTFIKAGI